MQVSERASELGSRWMMSQVKTRDEDDSIAMLLLLLLHHQVPDSKQLCTLAGALGSSPQLPSAVSGEIFGLGMIGQDPGVSKSDELHVEIFQFFF